MKNKTTLLLILVYLISSNCIHKKSNNQSNAIPEDKLREITLNSVWQLDLFTDQILDHRSISDQLENESFYAYQIQFQNDSCQFIGTRESWWNQFKKTSPQQFKTYHQENNFQFWELKFISTDKLLVREILKTSEQIDTGKFISYHKVDQILSLDSLNHLISKKIFAGRYKVIASDTFFFNKEVILKDNLEIQGIVGINSYSFEVSQNCCYPIFNAFGLHQNMRTSYDQQFSFKFDKDTLLLSTFKPVIKDGDFDHYEYSKPRVKLLKLR